MSNLSGYHHYLFLGKVSNTLSEAEEKELETLFSTNERAKEEYRIFLETLPPEDVHTSFKRYHEADFWKGHVPPQINRIVVMRRRWNMVKKTGIAAMLAGILVFSWFLYDGQFREKADGLVSLQKKETIQLKLANGDVIDLNAEQGNISRGNIALQNSNGTLIYQNEGEDAIGLNSILVPTGMDYKIVLSDGSDVWMNSTTTLEFPSKFAANKREVTVSGEAYFKVVKNLSKPFIVRLPSSTVQVTGTEFNVNSYSPSLTKVSLVEGGVNMRGGFDYKDKAGNAGRVQFRQ